MTPEERSERGRHAHKSLRARLVRELDPDGALPPEELDRLISEHYSQMGRRSARTRTARKVTAGPDDGPAAIQGPAVTQGVDACHGHPPAAGVRAPRPEVADVMPELLGRPEVLEVLTARDVGGLYRALRDTGVTQRQIADRAGQAQSEVCEIIAGR